MSKLTTDRSLRLLTELLQIPGNDVCADCKTAAPRWASYNIGIFICVHCASIHRKLGTHISKVKSVNLDQWTKEQIESVKVTGNVTSNAIYNPNNEPPPVNLHDSERDSELEKYIRNKYQYKTFMSSARVPASRAPQPKREETRQPSRTVTVSPPLTTKSTSPQPQPQRSSTTPQPPLQMTNPSPQPPLQILTPSPQPPLQMLSPSPQPPLQMLSPSPQPTLQMFSPSSQQTYGMFNQGQTLGSPQQFMSPTGYSPMNGLSPLATGLQPLATGMPMNMYQPSPTSLSPSPSTPSGGIWGDMAAIQSGPVPAAPSSFQPQYAMATGMNPMYTGMSYQPQFSPQQHVYQQTGVYTQQSTIQSPNPIQYQNLQNPSPVSMQQPSPTIIQPPNQTQMHIQQQQQYGTAGPAYWSSTYMTWP